MSNEAEASSSIEQLIIPEPTSASCHDGSYQDGDNDSQSQSSDLEDADFVMEDVTKKLLGSNTFENLTLMGKCNYNA